MTSKEKRETGRIYYQFSDQLAKNVLLPRSFARLRTHFIMGLRSKYAVTLYEILEGYANRRENSCTVTIDELKNWLKVPEHSYADWRELKKRVVGPAVAEINKDADGAGFCIDYEGMREGKADGRQEREAVLGRQAQVHKRVQRAAAGIPDPENPPQPSGSAIDAFRDKWPGNDPYEAIGHFQDKWRVGGCKALRSPDGAFLKFAEGMFKARATKKFLKAA